MDTSDDICKRKDREDCVQTDSPPPKRLKYEIEASITDEAVRKADFAKLKNPYIIVTIPNPKELDVPVQSEHLLMEIVSKPEYTSSGISINILSACHTVYSRSFISATVEYNPSISLDIAKSHSKVLVHKDKFKKLCDLATGEAKLLMGVFEDKVTLAIVGSRAASKQAIIGSMQQDCNKGEDMQHMIPMNFKYVFRYSVKELKTLTTMIKSMGFDLLEFSLYKSKASDNCVWVKRTGVVKPDNPKSAQLEHELCVWDECTIFDCQDVALRQDAWVTDMNDSDVSVAEHVLKINNMSNDSMNVGSMGLQIPDDDDLQRLCIKCVNLKYFYDVIKEIPVKDICIYVDPSDLPVMIHINYETAESWTRVVLHPMAADDSSDDENYE